MSLHGLWLLALAASPLDVHLPHGFEYPNGIAARSNGHLLIGSVTSGLILERAPDGTTRVLHGAQANPESLFAGTALELDEATNHLWVASPDFSGRGLRGQRAHRYAVLDASTGAVLASREVPDGGFVNDIALDGRGGAYLTDSALGWVWHVASPEARPRVHASGAALRGSGIGPAGIVRRPDGSLVVGRYDAGSLHLVHGDGRVEPIQTARPLRYLDGLELDADGTLYAIEGGLDEGDGRVVAIDLQGPTPHRVEVKAEGLDTPVNLVRHGRHLWVTESRFRHRMRPDLGLTPPHAWRMVRLDLDPSTRVAGELPLDFHPESITEAAGVFYLGSATRSEIFALRPGATPEAFVRAGAQGLMSVQGLLAAPERGRLYVCTGDLGKHTTRTSSSALLAFHLDTGAAEGRWPLPAGSFCNDLVAWRGGYLVTDTFGARLWHLDPHGAGHLRVWLEAPELKGANGIAVRGADVFVTTFSSGRLLRVTTEQGRARSVAEVALPRPLDGGDGLRALPDGRLLVFENGLIHGHGALSLIRLDGARAQLSRLLSSGSSPVSGAISGSDVVWPASSFSVLFGGAPAERRDPRIYRTPLPSPRKPAAMSQNPHPSPR